MLLANDKRARGTSPQKECGLGSHLSADSGFNLGWFGMCCSTGEMTGDVLFDSRNEDTACFFSTVFVISSILLCT